MLSKNSKPVYQLHKSIGDAYIATNMWLSNLPEANGYKTLTYPQVIHLLKLGEHTLLNAAAQYHTFFPAHYFKVICTLDKVVTPARLIDWLSHNPRICIVDIGCGAGAGSAAFVETVLRLQETDQLLNPVQIYCIGIDPNTYAVALYQRFLLEIKNRLASSALDLITDIKPNGIPSAASWIIQCLNQKREVWRIPNLPHIVVMQVNIVSPLDKDYEKEKTKYEILSRLGIDTNEETDTHSQFGIEQAIAYKSVFENVATDHMHILTIGTDNYLLDQRVKEMEAALEQVFSDSYHQVALLGGGECQVTFRNPTGGYYERKKAPYTVTFHVNAVSVTNKELQSDRDWDEVTSLENLRLAWVRTRHRLLDESFFDELEIRLFESNLDENLERMRQQLMAYAADIARVDDYVAYRIPKGPTETRPRGLSTLEEEILSVAIVQKLGRKESQLRRCSYAYRIVQQTSGRDTEYLYEYWFLAHQEYLRDARAEAEKLRGGAIFRTDIRSFFAHIEQNKLVQLATQVLASRKSQRVEWLIRLLLSRDLNEHELGKGIVQGSIGSGFYANIYLTSIDMLFGIGNLATLHF